MTRARQDRMLGMLLASPGWSTASSLAERLGVTPRSVRTYVSAVNARLPDDAIESGPLGYRAAQGAAASLDASVRSRSPQGRVVALVRALLDAPDGVPVASIAAEAHLSEATVEADLARVRVLLAGSGVELLRADAAVRLEGGERSQRRLLSRLVHDELDGSAAFTAQGLARMLAGAPEGGEALSRVRAGLLTGLAAAGYAVNDIAIDDVLLHIAIAADRVARHRPLEGGVRATPSTESVVLLLQQLSDEHLGVVLSEADLEHLAALVLNRMAVPQESGAEGARPDVVAAVQSAVRRAAAEFAIDIDDGEFIRRLALHVQHLVTRSRDRSWSRNPLTASLKSTHPMIFEIAVHVAADLRDALDIPLPDDEIAYLAMHIGGRIERSRRTEPRPTAVVVAPGYHDLPALLEASIDRTLGSVIEVIAVTTRFHDLADADLVLTTAAGGFHDNAVTITPFLTDADVERVHAAAARVRRARRLARLREELTRYLDPEGFVHGVSGSPEDVIRGLGARLVAQGVIDQEYVERTIEREEMSSTAFTETLAVPHSLTMTAARTAIAIGIADPALPWGDGQVQVVAMVAFSESDRAAFQTVFEQFVEVFADIPSAQRIVRRSDTFAGFVDELARVIDG